MADRREPMIGPLQPGEVAAALAILDAELGEGLYRPADVEGVIGDPATLALGAREGGELVAVAIGRLQEARDADYYAAFGDCAGRLFEAGRVGSLEALAVLPAARRRGLGAELIGRRLDWFAEQGCSSALAVAWMPATHPRGFSAPLFRRLGFSEGPLVREFYLAESTRDGWRCPADGNPCRCSAILFWKVLGT